jgi:catechol 2,3-dioxygenase-like lactoylglutathione lyase family enzyme
MTLTIPDFFPVRQLFTLGKIVGNVTPACDDEVVLDHISIQCVDVTASAAFYDAVLAPLGGQRVLDFGNVIGYGVPPQPVFWIGPHSTGTGFRESHLAFAAPDRAAVREFFRIAVESGAEPLHEPREWPEYHPGYYGAFVRDPDGNNIEAVSHTPT